MSLGFGVLETYTDVAPIEIDNRKFNAGDKEYCLQMIKKLHAFQDSVREVCSRLLDITECARERGDALNDLADYFADGVDSLERIRCSPAVTGNFILWRRRCRSEERYR